MSLARGRPMLQAMERIETDILVAGGGIAGMAAAARLAAAGRRVLLVERGAPGPRGDRRTTAFLRPAAGTLERAGAWAGMAAGATALSIMRIVDAGGRIREPRLTADFNASEIQDAPFGWNVANEDARAALEARLAALAEVRVLTGTGVEALTQRSSEALARLSDGRVAAARLVVAADGRDSTVRRLAGIPARRWRYGQRALVFAVTHERPHEGVSTEIHSSGGPCTLVPMADLDGRPASSVVWMVPEDRAARLAALPDEALGAELTAETMGLAGAIRVASPRASWPMIGQMAARMAGERVALVAEAAHVIPPIGAQGLNMSLADVETLAGLVEPSGDPGARGVLGAYERRRLPETAARVAGIDILNRAARTGMQPLKDLRAAGLGALHGAWPIRHLAMRLGMGAGG